MTNAETDIRTDLEQMVRRIACEIDTVFSEYDGEDVEDDYGRVLNFLETVLDFQWIIASDCQTMRGCELLVTWGGPNIWVNTQDGIVSGYWGSERAELFYRTDGEGARLLYEALMNIWEC